MSVRVPTTSARPSYSQVTDLGATAFRLTLDYNGRDGAWYVSVATQGGTVLVAGRKLRIAWPLLRQFTDARMPAGRLIAPDLDGSGVEPGRDDLGDRLQLLYE